MKNFKCYKLFFIRIRMENSIFNTLVLSGGGIRGLAQLGALHVLHEKNMLDVHNYIGTSIGSLICLLLNIGYAPLELFTLFLEMKMDKNLFAITLSSMKKFVTHKGFNNISEVLCDLESIIYKKINKIPTFLELFEQTQKKLIVVVVNLTKKKVETFDYINSPDLLVSTAIYISCNIPIIFTEQIYNDCNYIDGGLVNNFPLDKIEDSMTNILGISVLYESDSTDSLIDYILSILYFPFISLYNYSLTTYKHKLLKHIELKLNYSLLDLTLTNEEKMKIFVSGINNVLL